MAATAHTSPAYQPRGDTMSFVIKDGTSIWRGSIVELLVGYLGPWTDAAGSTLCGVLFNGDVREKTGSNAGKITGETSDSPPPEGVVLTGGVTLMHLDSVVDESGAAIAQADVGKAVYCGSSSPDDFTLATTGGTHKIGVITRFRSATDIDITLFSMMEHVAQKET